MFETLKADLALYTDAPTSKHATGRGFPNWFKMIVRVLFRSEIRAIMIYRYGSWAFNLKIPSGPLRPIVKLWRFLHLAVHFLWSKRSLAISGIYLPAAARIGPGLFIAHPGMIFIHPDCVIGSHLLIYPGALVGGNHSDDDVPVMGDHVTLGAGCKVLGPIRVGSNVIIGANAVVVHDVPDNSVACGVPAVVKKRIWSEKQADGSYPMPEERYTLPAIDVP